MIATHTKEKFLKLHFSLLSLRLCYIFVSIINLGLGDCTTMLLIVMMSDIVSSGKSRKHKRNQKYSVLLRYVQKIALQAIYIGSLRYSFEDQHHK